MMSENLLPMDEQTELEIVIKIRLQADTKARRLLMRQSRIHKADGGDPEDWAAFRATGTDRQKTNIVIKTREEATSLKRFLKLAHGKSDNTHKALQRVESELSNELLRQGLKFDIEDAYHPDILEINGAVGEAPPSPGLQPGDIVRIRGKHLGWKNGGEPSEDYRSVPVEALGPEKVLLDDSFTGDGSRLIWASAEHIDGLDRDAMEQRDVRRSVREKRRQADFDALAELCKRHAKQVADDVWTDTVPVDDITFQFNNRLSYHGGFYYPRTHSSRPAPRIELATERYVDYGLSRVLDIVRHELIHAWQDYHPDGHPPDAHKHHGRDFKQWTDALNTS